MFWQLLTNDTNAFAAYLHACIYLYSVLIALVAFRYRCAPINMQTHSHIYQQYCDRYDLNKAHVNLLSRAVPAMSLQ